MSNNFSKNKAQLSSKKSAEETYKDLEKQAEKLQKSIKSKLDAHCKQFEKDPKNWGFPGDLGHVVELLEQIDKFLK